MAEYGGHPKSPPMKSSSSWPAQPGSSGLASYNNTNTTRSGSTIPSTDSFDNLKQKKNRPGLFSNLSFSNRGHTAEMPAPRNVSPLRRGRAPGVGGAKKTTPLPENKEENKHASLVRPTPAVLEGVFDEVPYGAPPGNTNASMAVQQTPSGTVSAVEPNAVIDIERKINSGVPLGRPAKRGGLEDDVPDDDQYGIMNVPSPSRNALVNANGIPTIIEPKPTMPPERHTTCTSEITMDSMLHTTFPNGGRVPMRRNGSMGGNDTNQPQLGNRTPEVENPYEVHPDLHTIPIAADILSFPIGRASLGAAGSGTRQNANMVRNVTSCVTYYAPSPPVTASPTSREVKENDDDFAKLEELPDTSQTKPHRMSVISDTSSQSGIDVAAFAKMGSKYFDKSHGNSTFTDDSEGMQEAFERSVTEMSIVDSQVSPPGDHDSAEEQMKKAIELSLQESSQWGSAFVPKITITDEAFTEVKTAARNLRDAASSVDMDYKLVQSLIDECTRAQERIERWGQLEGLEESMLIELFGVADLLNTAIDSGTRVINNMKKPPATIFKENSSLEIENLVEKRDIFTLLATLRAHQNDRRLDAALALMTFARDDEESRTVILSSGGIHSLLNLFRSTKGDHDALKAVCALAVAYMVPLHFLTSKQTPIALFIKVMDCIRFLSRCESPVSGNNFAISQHDLLRAVINSLKSVWMDYIAPRIHSETPSDDSLLGQTKVAFDKRQDFSALRELAEMAVNLIIDLARRTDDTSLSELVEQVCRIEVARPMAVREGVLQILVLWLDSKSTKHILSAIHTLHSLTAVKDDYMAGWIHSEIVNKGAVRALANLTDFERKDMQMVRLTIAEIISSLCIAPQTQVAVIEANCIGFLVGFLLHPADSPSGDAVLESVGSALIRLAVGAVTRSSILGVDLDFTGMATSDKRSSLIQEITESGAAAFIALARNHKDRLRCIAVEALRVLSDDCSPVRKTRLLLCEKGAASALGIVLRDDFRRIPPKLPIDRAFLKFSDSSLKRVHHAIHALANILDSSPGPAKNSKAGSDPNAILIKGCIDTARDGGFDAILTIASLPCSSHVFRNTQNEQITLLEEACRCIVSVSPHLLNRAVADAGYAKYADLALNAVHNMLEQLLSSLECDNTLNERALELHELALQGLGILATYDPLKIRIIARTLPFLFKTASSGESTCKMSAASQALQYLELSGDHIDLQVQSNNVGLVVDWFCLQRSLILQAVVRTEIRELLKSKWNEAFDSRSNRYGRTSLIRLQSDKSHSGEGSVSPSLFMNLADDDYYMTKLERLVQQYADIYGDRSASGKNDGSHYRIDSMQDSRGSQEGVLSNQIYPLSSSIAETEWVLAHNAFMRAIKHEPTTWSISLSSHARELLELCFPSKLLMDQILPHDSFRPESSFNFRALMMPERRYFSFSREGKLISRICEKECEDDAHWTLNFTNSTFDGEFAESLVQILYVCPVIKGLSFVRNNRWEHTRHLDKDAKQGDGFAILANLSASLPPWVSHLTFDGVLSDDDLETLATVLETVGKLSESQMPSVEKSKDVVANLQGKFSFLAIRNSPSLSPDAWQLFAKLLGGKTLKSQVTSRKPLASLKSLDLSFNNLGDDLCSLLLKTIYSDETSCLEELDLSGNSIREGTKVIKTLKKIGESVRDRKKFKWSLHTLRLASNDLGAADSWLTILSQLQQSGFQLQVLDYSSNDIYLYDPGHFSTLVQMIVRCRELVQLNLSRNSLTPEAVDEILSKLGNSSADCSLAFLDLSENEPPLSPQQSDGLLSFLKRSRRYCVDHCLERRARDGGASGRGKEMYVDDLLDDEASVFTAHDALSLSSSGLPFAGLGNMITVLFSAPLVFKDGSGNLRPFPKLNFDIERELIWQCMKEASRDIELWFDNATPDRLLAAVSKRCRCLHYSGHGHKDYLPFEDGKGGPKWLPVDEIKNLICRDGTVPFRFVFVSACFSGLAGQTFASAGVPHVVCCQQDYELKDAAALAFTRQFYLSLAVGNTVREAFEHGCKAVRTSPNLKDAEQEMKKFILLPEGGNHDVPIFNARQIREWPRLLAEDAQRNLISSRSGKATSRNSPRSLELAVRNLLQEDPSPSPPQFFLGREAQIYQVLNRLCEKRLVSVVGEPGIGRSSLVCAVCHYINERKNIMSTSFEKIYFVKAKQNRKRNRLLALVRQLMKKLSQDGTISPVDDDEDIESMIEAICRGLKSAKSLIVFDRVEYIEESDGINELPMLIRELCRETNNVRFLLTNSRPLGIPSLGEHYIALEPLNLDSTVRLFAYLCPFVHTPADRKNLLECLVPSKEIGDLCPSDDMSEEMKYLFEILGRGIPSRIENAAYCIDKTDLASLRKRSFLDL